MERLKERLLIAQQALNTLQELAEEIMNRIPQHARLMSDWIAAIQSNMAS